MSKVIPIQSEAAPRFSTLPPLYLYLHMPWCVSKCPYCDFNSHALKGKSAPFARYVDALIADLEQSLPDIWGRSVYGIFMGGGTPSLFPPEQIERLLSLIRARLPLLADAEITLEANPDSFEAGRFREFRAAGINRLSIGVQSFDNQKLQTLGRAHDAQQAIRAAEHAARLFNNFNLDLMFALPGQSRAQLANDLQIAHGLAPTHLSCYQLTIEANTWFAFQPPVLPDPDLQADMQQMVVELNAAQGYQRYEVSAFAQAGKRCQHNLNYWMFGDYLGLGAGAHGKLTFPDKVMRHARLKHPEAYLQASPNTLEQNQLCSSHDLVFDFMLNALRLQDGFATALFQERTGLPLAMIEAPLQQAVQRGLLTYTPQTITPTELGYRFLTDLQALFL